ncbi:MAG: ABC transporter ATP-binding protein [Clostridiales bacterium]|nr:ABC transporter ATP-binding protein [Clostridiales bacterium]
MTGNEKVKPKFSLKTLVRMMKGYKRHLLFSALALVIAALVWFAIPYVSSIAVDYIIGGNEDVLPSIVKGLVESIGGREYLVSHFYILPLLLIVLTLANGLFVFLRGRNISIAAEGMAKNMRDSLYEHLQLVPYDYHKHISTGDIIQRCTSDVDTVRRFISNQLLEVIRPITMVVITSYIMFSYNVKMALVSVALLPILSISSYFYFKYVRKYFSYSDEAEGKLSAVLQENLTGMRVVRAFAQQKNELKKFTDSNKDYMNKTYKLINMLAIYWGLSDMLGYLQILLSLVFGVYFAVTADFTVGGIMLFTAYTAALTWPVRQLGRVLADMGKASVSISRLDDIFNHPKEAEPGKALKPEIIGDIEFKNVCFAYEENDNVLDNISFTAKQGQTIAILGSTGSGKTSLVQLLQRLYPVTGGSITIDGVNINDIEMHHLRKNIGIVLQEPFLFSRTIMENIRITNPDATEESVYAAAKVASVHDVICSFENGYETLVGERGVTLSGGQKQRVAIARMLLQNAPILILDDSLSAVDTETDMAIRDALNKRKGSATTFIISHRITTLCYADKILVLENGKIVQQGIHEQLIAQEGLYKRIAQIQDMLEVELMDGSENNEQI